MILEEKQILTAKALYAKRKKADAGKTVPLGNQSIVVGFWEREYQVSTSPSFKTYSKSYKLKKRIPNEPEEYMFYLRTHRKRLYLRHSLTGSRN